MPLASKNKKPWRSKWDDIKLSDDEEMEDDNEKGFTREQLRNNAYIQGLLQGTVNDLSPIKDILVQSQQRHLETMSEVIGPSFDRQSAQKIREQFFVPSKKKKAMTTLPTTKEEDGVEVVVLGAGRLGSLLLSRLGDKAIGTKRNVPSKTKQKQLRSFDICRPGSWKQLPRNPKAVVITFDLSCTPLIMVEELWEDYLASVPLVIIYGTLASHPKGNTSLTEDVQRLKDRREAEGFMNSKGSVVLHLAQIWTPGFMNKFLNIVKDKDAKVNLIHEQDVAVITERLLLKPPPEENDGRGKRYILSSGEYRWCDLAKKEGLEMDIESETIETKRAIKPLAGISICDYLNFNFTNIIKDVELESKA